jgi:NAD(P)-dependent dehydrogenase (short-subunit alcohol dehydrogenase family)
VAAQLTKGVKVIYNLYSNLIFMALIKTSFGFQSTTDDVIEGIDLTGKRAIVTGGASGIGVETVKALAKAGAEVTIAARNLEAGKKVADEVIAATGNHNIYAAQLDLDNLNSITDFVDNWQGALHILINNAGVVSWPYPSCETRKMVLRCSS